MAHTIIGSEKYRDLSHDDAYRWYLVTRNDSSADYRFGRRVRRRADARTAFSRLNGYLKNMIEAVANSKMRRLERELELRGIRFDRSNQGWTERKAGPAERLK